jgi:hypothetical protein
VVDGHANPEENPMMVNAKLLRYLEACLTAAAGGAAWQNMDWMEVCPECGHIPQTYDTDHLIVEVGDVPDAPENIMAVVVACEGYYAVDPMKLGLGAEHPNWTAPDSDVIECTCDGADGETGVHFPTCPAATVGPVKG